MPAEPFRHFHALTDAQARRRGEATAILDRGRAVSFAELHAETERLAGAFLRLGIGPGDRVGLWLPNVPAWLAAFLALARIGAVAVAINLRFRSAELAEILGRSGAKALLLWPGFKGTDFAGVLAEIPRERITALAHVIAYDEGERTHLPWPALRYADLAASEPVRLPEPANRPCAVFTTSGTTKAPKFVLHDQATLLRHAHDCVRAFAYDAPGAVVLLALPFSGVFGFCSALPALVAGRPLLVAPSFDAAAQARQISEHGVTHLNATSAMIEQLLAHADSRPFPSLRELPFASFSPGLDALLAEAEPKGLRLIGLYGSSELQALAARQPADAPLEERRQGGGVLVAPEGRVRAVDPETGTVLPHGSPGELEFRVPSRMLGYMGDPEATAAAFTADGYFRSGDLGHTLAENRFVFLARLGDSLRLGGYLVSPAEIEGVVEEIPAVGACQVVAVEQGRARRPVAFVIPRPGAEIDEAAILAHCGRRLAKYKIPIRAFAVESFPVTEGPNGTKIQKNRLQELALRRLAEDAARAENPEP
jgi:fatty-acyl-CoA synthase